MEQLRLRYYLFLFLVRTARGYVRNSVANVVKRALGRQPYFDEDEAVFGAWLEHLLGLRPKPKMTSRGRPGEGAGSQARLTMCAMNFARVLGFDYVHTPFRAITHAEGPMESWVKAWENEFNLGAGEKLSPEDAPDVFDFAALYGILVHRVGLRNFYAIFNVTSAEFRRKYYLNKDKRTNTVLIVAVHIRRGDVTSDGEPDLWTELAEVAATIETVRNVLSAMNMPFRIQIYSEGNAEELREFEDAGAELFLGKDAVWTLREMIEADVLVMGKGFFSYVAAIISDGVKLYDSWRYPPLKGWIVRAPGGGFDARAFIRSLETSTVVSPLK
jgi:hypothetical protein